MDPWVDLEVDLYFCSLLRYHETTRRLGGYVLDATGYQ